MSSRISLVVAVVVATVLIAGEALLVLRERSDERWFDATDRAVT